MKSLNVDNLTNLDSKSNSIKNFYKFIDKFIKEFQKVSINYYKQWEDIPFIYKERQLNSIVIPSMFKCSNNVFLELPFKKKDNKQRFLDLYVEDEKNIYFIELKHAWHNYNSKELQSYTFKEWETALEQIDDITLDNKSIFEKIEIGNKKVFRIALMVMPTFIVEKENFDLKNINSIQNHNDQIYSYFEESYKKDQSSIPNYISTWGIDNFSIKYDERKEYYPFISFVMRVEDIS